MTDEITAYIAELRTLIATAVTEGNAYTGVPVHELSAVLDALAPVKKAKGEKESA